MSTVRRSRKLMEFRQLSLTITADQRRKTTLKKQYSEDYSKNTVLLAKSACSNVKTVKTAATKLQNVSKHSSYISSVWKDPLLQGMQISKCPPQKRPQKTRLTKHQSIDRDYVRRQPEYPIVRRSTIEDNLRSSSSSRSNNNLSIFLTPNSTALYQQNGVDSSNKHHHQSSIAASKKNTLLSQDDGISATKSTASQLSVTEKRLKFQKRTVSDSHVTAAASLERQQQQQKTSVYCPTMIRPKSAVNPKSKFILGKKRLRGSAVKRRDPNNKAVTTIDDSNGSNVEVPQWTNDIVTMVSLVSPLPSDTEESSHCGENGTTNDKPKTDLNEVPAQRSSKNVKFLPSSIQTLRNFSTSFNFRPIRQISNISALNSTDKEDFTVLDHSKNKFKSPENRNDDHQLNSDGNRPNNAQETLTTHYKSKRQCEASTKEQECWEMYRKMSTLGIRITYDTILRGLLTPTEYRTRNKKFPTV